MSGRTLVLLLAGTVAACSSPAKEGRKADEFRATVSPGSVQPVTASMPYAKLRDSFQLCVDRAAGATWPMQDCIEEELEYQDARLNKIYQALMKASTEEQRTELRLRERQWLSTRDANCPWDDDTQGQGHRIEGNYCVMEKTALRADELEADLKQLGSSAH